jgi:hypothetical protein
MTGTTLIQAVRDEIIDGDLGVNGVFIAGSVDPKVKLPYVVLSLLPSSFQPAGTDVSQVGHGVQIDVLAGTLSAAVELSDEIDSLILSLGGVPVEGGVPFGVLRASGSWRTVFPAEPSTANERLQRVASLYTQTEFRP